MEPTPQQIASFPADLRHAITLLAEVLPTAETRLVESCGAWYTRAVDQFRFRGIPVLEQLLQIAALVESCPASWPNEHERSKLVSASHTFVDDWPLPYEAPLTEKPYHVMWCFRHLTEPPPVPLDGKPVLDSAAIAAVTRYREWRPSFDRARLAKEAAFRTAREAAAPPHRALPHQPDPPSLLMARTHADGVIGRATVTPAARRSPEENAALASSHLTRGLVGHWLKMPPAVVRADLDQAAELMATALSHVPLHAWLYEQWQHLAIAIGHAKLLHALWTLRQSDWDNDRIRPVDWLVGRIRLLDLLLRDGSEAGVRDLLEKCRLGLFVETLPSELAPDLPLMRCWYHLLRAIILRDVAAFDQRLAERHDLIAAYWKRGGGVAPLSLIDLGGVALLRTAQARGLRPAVVDRPYLPSDFPDPQQVSLRQ